MNRFVNLMVTAGTALCLVGQLHATGYFGPYTYLDEGGKKVEGSPEFYWGLEVRRISRDFHPPEKLVVPKEGSKKIYGEPEESTKKTTESTTETDLKDFDAAVTEGRIKPPDPSKAKEEHKQARTALDASASGTPTPLGAEFDSEFADYHKGAAAYLNQQWDQARAAWETLLKRPEQNRHYRTIWAAFMLGKAALKEKDFQRAAEWFQRTRELAKAGFADSLGLAAESYGWEGRAEWKQDHPAKAAQLFMNQLALGDATAVVSLKALIPDRDPVSGLLNYGPEPDEREQWTDQQKRDEQQKEMAKLKVAAQDPLLRRLVTVHILSTAVSPDYYYTEGPKKEGVNRSARWFNIIKQANLGQVEDAEYLGWISYDQGEYKDAAHWLELTKAESAPALWLKAKLQLRAGKFSDATNAMAKAVEIMRTSPAYSAREGEEWATEDLSSKGEYWGFASRATGDLGGLQLARGDFVQALDVLFKGQLWEDAAFVAERVLTANELKEYIDALPKTESPKEGEDYNSKLRYLLGRRLVREDRYDEARQYLSSPYDKILEKYVKALKDGANEKLSKTERAHAWFTAAWLARHDGMELMGTEGPPDAYAEGGSFEMPDLAKERRTGTYQTVAYDKEGNTSSDENGNPKMKSVPAFLKASAREVQRLNTNKIAPDIRFHYRLIAGALAMKAAALLSDNSEELADVVNTAGLWVKDRDEKTGNRYMQVIERRCAKTKIGRADTGKHWFVDQKGPWSTAEEQAYRAMHKELGIGSTDEEQSESN
jgi:hypothetical protein